VQHVALLVCNNNCTCEKSGESTFVQEHAELISKLLLIALLSIPNKTEKAGVK
jgi:hypothetical protein